MSDKALVNSSGISCVIPLIWQIHFIKGFPTFYAHTRYCKIGSVPGAQGLNQIKFLVIKGISSKYCQRFCCWVLIPVIPILNELKDYYIICLKFVICFKQLYDGSYGYWLIILFLALDMFEKEALSQAVGCSLSLFVFCWAGALWHLL